MSLSLENKARKIVPRWRSPVKTFAMGEFTPVYESSRTFDTKHLEKKVTDWLENKTFSYAADLISSAFVLEETDGVKDVAKYILKSSPGIPNGIEFIARKILDPDYGGTEASFVIGGFRNQKKKFFFKNRFIFQPRDGLFRKKLKRLF